MIEHRSENKFKIYKICVLLFQLCCK